MASSYKAEGRTGNLASVVGDAFGVLQSLRDEMREWADNLENGNLGHTQKCQDVASCADELDNVADDEPEVPASLGDLEVTYTEMVNRRKGRGPSRATQRDNATGMLEAAIQALDALEEQTEEAETPENEELAEALEQEIQTLRDELQNVIDTANGAEFPGMY